MQTTTNAFFVLTSVLLACVLLGAPALAEDAEQEKSPAKLETDADRESYSIGVQVGNSLKQLDAPIELDVLMVAIEDVLEDRAPALSDEEIREVMTAMQQRMQAEREEEAGLAKERGQAWLAENAEKEGVVELESGLQYKVLEEGSGESPSASDTVKVHYRGTLVDGTEFDSSYKRGEPAQFAVNQVINGWTEALQLMTPGAKWKLFIPSDLAYGQNPPPRSEIPPNATLLFEVELLEVL